MYPTGASLSTRDYRDFNGFGTSSPEEVLELKKALAAGDDVNNPGTAPGVGFPLRVESLEGTLKNVSFEMDEIKLFKSIPKVPAQNTVEEFNRLTSYSNGGARAFDLGWMEEGDLPEEEDSTYERVVVQLKYLGVTGRVTNVMNVVKAAHGDAIALETMNKTMFMLQQLEHTAFFGDNSLLSQQFDGLRPLIESQAPDNIVDLRGGALTEETVNDGFLRIRDNLGMATDLYAATGPFADLAKLVLDRQRFMNPSVGEPGVLGAQIRQYQGQHGKAAIHDSIFIQPGDVPFDGLGPVAKRPITPTISVAPSAGANASSQFAAADAGVYFWKVVARNRYGASVAVTTASETVAAGESVTFTIADGGQGTAYYEIFRTDPGAAASTAKKITRVARTGATQVFTDHNDDIPGTSDAFLLQQNDRSFAWSQLLPLTRVPLAAVDTSIRWAQILYGGIKMYAGQRNVVFKNVGRLD